MAHNRVQISISPNVRFGSLADICSATSDVRFTPKSRHVRRNYECPLRANSATHAAQRSGYSITSSARASSEGGTVMPSTFAVLRLMTSSNLVGTWTGSSVGFSPLRMRSI
jgi:hypothetical protein